MAAKPGVSGGAGGISAAGTSSSLASTSAAATTRVEEDDETSSHSPANVLDFQKSVHKRLDAMTDRQDSITALSLWMIHHKTQCQKIAACWLAAMKRAKVSRRLHLFYLANDVVQCCRKKNAKIYLLAFKNVLKDAVVLVRDSSIKHKIERIFHIWEERETYFIDFVNELRELLNDREKVTAHVSAANFKPHDVIESLRKVKMLETHVAMKQKLVANLKVDASRMEAVKELKDRSHSHDFAKQFDDSYIKMQGYVKMLENEIDQRSKLIENLENGQTFYEVQNDDAMVVANAYRNFGIRISNLKKRLIDYKDTLTDETDSPIPSPSAEAPSPGNTPPLDAGDDDMDMELSDPEDATDGKIIASEPYAPAGSSSLTDRLAAMGAALPGTVDPRQAKTATVECYSPAEQLQREKVAATDNSLDHKFLFSMVAAKAQPAAGRRDKSVLKDLTEFAEKVKNPPPKDWSEFNRKRMEKQLAEQKAAEEAAKKVQLEQEAVQQEYVPGSYPAGGEREDNYQPSGQSPESMSYTPTPVTAATQLQFSSAETSTSESAAAFSDSQPSLAGQYASTNFASQSVSAGETRANSTQEVEPNALQSMSWPPSNSPSSSAEVPPSPPVQLPSIPRPPAPAKMSAPIRPPLLKPATSVVQTIAPHIQITKPVAPQSPIISIGGPPARPAMRPQGGVVTVSSAPPPPPTGRTRTFSNEQQRDALNLLDNLHAESSGDGSNIPPVQQGNRIQTLGNNISPVVNRSYPVMNRPPAPPRYNNYNNYRPPPAKRPFEQYGGNYHYY